MTFCNHCWISSGILPDVSISISEIVFSQVEREEHSAQNVERDYLCIRFCLISCSTFLLEMGGNLSETDTFPPVSSKFLLKYSSFQVCFCIFAA
jgi:hypothetical protein